MTRTPADEWANVVHARYGTPKVLAKRIIAPGPETPNGRRHMTESAANLLLSLVAHSGVNGSHAKAYLVDLLRWHLGYTNAPTPTGELTTLELEFIRRRAHALIDEHRSKLPPIERDRIAT